MLSVVVLLTSGYAAAFAPGFISFTVIEFIVGAGMHGAFIICTVLGKFNFILNKQSPKEFQFSHIPACTNVSVEF